MEKQSITIFDSFTEDELAVAQILLQLNDLMSLSESLKKSKPNWGSKSRRSAMAAPPPSSRAPSLPSPPDIKEGNGGGATAGSPETPLCFPLSESEQNPEPSSKTSSKKMSKEKYIATIEELTLGREVLKGELEKVKKHYKNLKDFNSQLKSIKQEVLNTSLSGGLNIGTELAPSPPITVVPHPQPLIADPTSQNLHNPFGPITAHLQPSNNRPESVNHVGPSGIDLNISAQESHGVDSCQPLDAISAQPDQRPKSAEVRRRIVKVKSMRTTKI